MADDPTRWSIAKPLNGLLGSAPSRGLDPWAGGQEAEMRGKAGRGGALSYAGSRWSRARQLVALSAFAFAQPLLGLLAGHPGFLVAHWVMSGDLALLLVGLFLLPPLLLFALQWAAGVVSPSLENFFHGLGVTGLGALIVLPLLNRFVPQTDLLGVVLAVGVGVGLAFCAARFPKIRESVEFLWLAPILFLAVFFANPDMRVFALQFRATAVLPPAVRAPVPIVVVVFDELPLTSLLDAHGQIDSTRYPAFAEFAAGATWFRNATSVTSYTQQAVPAILTGRYPGTEPALAVASEHPRNLFSLLAGSHQLNAFESQMQLGHPDVLPRPPLGPRLQGLAGDLLVLYLHMIAPDSLVGRLPDVTETWRGFGGGAAIPAQLGGTHDAPRVNHPAEFRRFVASIDVPGEAGPPPLHFIHSVLPHRPWQYLPSGNVYFPYEQHGVEKGFGTKSGDWWQQEAYQRHLLQLAFVDRLLGELLERLEQVGLYEQALIVVTADHGVGFWPDDNARIVGASAHPEDILGVPLLIKAPAQTRAAVSLRNVETIDILPTLADAVGADFASTGEAASAWEFDGCSLFDSACPERADKRAYSSPDPTPKMMDELRFEPALGLRTQSLARKLDWFGSGLFAFGPYASVVGELLETLPVGTERAGRIVLETGRRPAFHDATERRVPVRISGHVELEADPAIVPYVAVAVAGRVQTIVPAPLDDNHMRRVLAIVPEASMLLGDTQFAEEFGFYRVEGSLDTLQLSPLDVSRDP